MSVLNLFSQKTYLESLEKNCLFRGINLEEKLLASFQGICTYFSKNSHIIEENALVDTLHIILTGQLNVAKIGYNGSEVLLQKLKASFLVGADIACTPTGKSPFLIYCCKDATLFSFPFKVLDKPGFIQEEKRLILYKNLLQFLANENMRKYYKIDALSTKSTRERVLKYLLVQAHIQKSNKVEIHFNREELANYLCVNKSVLSHELKKMEKDSLISFRKNIFTIHKENL